MPRVVEDQRGKFQTDFVLQQLQADTEIRYTGNYDCGLAEKRLRFRADCHEGTCKIGFVCNGINLLLSFPKPPDCRYTTTEFVDFSRETGKVFISCPLIFNGVSVVLRGYLDVDQLVGVGRLEFNEQLAQKEHYTREEALGRQNYDRL